MEAATATSIEVFEPGEWNRLFPDEPENWAYYRAVERARLPGFEWLYFALRAGGRLLAVVPGFLTDYHLDTTMTGTLRKISDGIQRMFPRFLRQRMIALGSPVSEICHLGFDPELDDSAREHALDALLDEFERRAKIERAKILAVKDSSSAQDALWSKVLRLHRLRRQPGLPTAVLDLPYASVDGYLQSLSRATRRDLRRKLRAGTGIRVEWRTRIDGIVDDIARLYAATRDNAEFNFEELTPDYFQNVLTDCAPNARCATFWIGDKLVAFNLVLFDEHRLIDKFLGMDYSVARSYNLYFYTWVENIHFCIDHRIPLYQSGQGLHHQKVHLGSRLLPNWLWYRHRNRAIDAILAAFERLARLDRNDPQLAAITTERAA